VGRRSHAALTAALLVAAAALFASAACRRDSTDWRILQLYSGETSVDVLRTPSKVRAFRVDPAGRTPKQGEVHAGPFIANGAAVDAPDDAAAELSALFGDAASYDWQLDAKKCRPQMGLNFVRGAYVLELALDLESAQVRVFAGDQPLGWQSVAPSRDRLVAAAKRLFPNDPAVQALR
jgi:hypothetical protein